ncbi:glycosyltransferase [Lachnospiraceae bacterium SGI.066]
MKKILFLIHDLGQGGAEKVLVNLVNHMDYSKFDVTVMTLFDCGENRQFLCPEITYKYWKKSMIPGNSHFMKIFTPEQLHKMIIKDQYDVEVAYLEGPCARVISGCTNSDVKLISWIHIEQRNKKAAATSFRSVREAKQCYGKFHEIISVSEAVQKSFWNALHLLKKGQVLYNTVNSKEILEKSKEKINLTKFKETEVKIVAVGKLLKSKGFDRLLRIMVRLLKEGCKVHLYILGDGPMKSEMKKYITDNYIEKYVDLLGYQLNPYKYIAKCDLFVCTSYAEGFSTAATEALILGIPVCTVDVAGMKEMLGENDEYGIIVSNNENALYEKIKLLVERNDLLDHYTRQAKKRGSIFCIEETVSKVEEMLLSL